MRASRLFRAVVCLTLSASLLSSSGCSLFVGKMQAVKITASDPSAQLFVDGAPAGTGSTSIELDRTRSHTVVARTYAGKTGAAAINKKISATGVLDIVGGIFFLVPFVGVVGAGFWELDPDAVTVMVQ